ncbi:MAG: T9SS type A sorting domain-containing protein [Flavobacteriales bacterium]|nr:T9SS type A sorting domain-containing protein [Flavobacteriales bacterium]
MPIRHAEKLFIVAFLLTWGDVAAQTGYDWVQRASLPAAARYGSFNFVVGDYGYVAGGGNSNAIFLDCWRYSPSTDTWEQMADMPTALRHGAAFAINGKGYVSCGQNGSPTFSTALYCYDPVSDSWSTKASLPAYARYGPYAFAIGGYGYLGGGNRGSAEGPYLDDLWQYDPILDSWSESTGIPGLARYGSTALVIDGKGYVQGGRDQSLDFTTELWEFEPTGQSWNLKPSMPGVGRSWSMVMAFPYEAVIAGGKDSGTVIYHDSYRYYPYTDSWVGVPDYPGGSGWSGTSFGIGTRTFGGLGKEYVPTEQFFNDFWELVKGENVSVDESLGSATGGALRVVPNPAASGQSIQISLGSLSPGTGRFSVSDAMGRTVLQGTMSRVVTLPSLTSGSYQVRFYNEGGSAFHGRFMVE